MAKDTHTENDNASCDKTPAYDSEVYTGKTASISRKELLHRTPIGLPDGFSSYSQLAKEASLSFHERKGDVPVNPFEQSLEDRFFHTNCSYMLCLSQLDLLNSGISLKGISPEKLYDKFKNLSSNYTDLARANVAAASSILDSVQFHQAILRGTIEADSDSVLGVIDNNCFWDSICEDLEEGEK